jgi:phosphoglycolate phosphatase
MVGRGLEHLVADLVGEEHVEDGVSSFREHYADVYLAKTFPLPTAHATLRDLHDRGYSMAVASNKPARFSEVLLREFGMLPFLDCVQGPDTSGTLKPDPAMLRNCLRSMSLEKDNALYVGDMVLDVETAARAGLPVALVMGGSSREAELRRTGECVLPCLGELLNLLP